MKIKSLYMFGLLAAATAFTACDDAKEPTYTPAAPVDVPAAYFNATDKSAFAVGETDTEVTYSIWREKAGEAATVTLTSNVTVTDESGAEVDASNMFTIPTTVNFAADATTASFPINFVATQLLPNVPYYIHLSVGDGLETPYFAQVATVSVRYTPWDDVLGPNGETAAILYDGFLNGLAGIGEFSNEVKIQQSPAIAGLYRVVNPYKPGNPAAYIRPADPDYVGDYYMYFNASNPAKVFICDENGNAKTEEGTVALFNTGVQVNFTSGLSTPIYGTGIATLRLAQGRPDDAEGYYGTLRKGILTFPDGSLLVTTEEDLNSTGSLYTGAAEMFKLVFPGVNEEESESWAELGDCTFSDGVIAPLFGISATPVAYDVPIQQSEENPGLYRIINPYKEGICPYGIGYDGDVKIVIDCSDPECVYVKLQETGVVDESDGPVYLLNYAFNLKQGGYSADRIIQAGCNDVLANGVITFGLGLGTGMEAYSHLLVNFAESTNLTEDGEKVSNMIYFTRQPSSITLPGAAASMPAKRMTVKNSPVRKMNKSYIDCFKAFSNTVAVRKNTTSVSL